VRLPKEPVDELCAPAPKSFFEPAPRPSEPISSRAPCVAAGREQTQRWNPAPARDERPDLSLAHVRPEKKRCSGRGQSRCAASFFGGEAPCAKKRSRGAVCLSRGQLLTRMNSSMGLKRRKRNKVYIGNIMNWRPSCRSRRNVLQYESPPTPAELAYLFARI